jgi:CelD/BcsL family acetyltransferase involved in cellulose biosynthesis
MHWTVIKRLDQFQNLAKEWNSLLACSASHVPFLRHEYLVAWWKTLGGGEWEQGELYIVLARRENGELAGAAPLFLTNNPEGEKALLLLGSIEISDYLDILGCLEDLPIFVEGLLMLIAEDPSVENKVLDLYNILESSPLLPCLKEKAGVLGWRMDEERLKHCPYIPIPGDWETYLAGIDKKQRHEIRRKIRRAENWESEWNEPVRWYIVENEQNLESEMDAFMDLMAQDPEKDRFLTRQMRAQLQSAARAAFDHNWLQLAFLEVGNTKVAGYLNFDYDNHIWVYNSGLNFGYRELSPGWVLLGYLLQWANENKRNRFDFMRGDEEYKYRFGGVDRFVVRARLSKA